MSKSISSNLIVALLSTLFFIACTEDTKKVEGNIIEMDFSNIEDISQGSWVKIDQWKFTHVRSIKEGVKTSLALPSTYILVDSLETGKKVGTPIASRAIGLHLASNLVKINNEKLPIDSPKYEVINPGLISVAGILKFKKTDSSKITVESPQDYPVSIKVVEN